MSPVLHGDLRAAARHLRRHPGYTFINGIGLAVGLAVCAFIVLYVVDELSYDRFHEHADRIGASSSQLGLVEMSVQPYIPSVHTHPHW